MSHQAVSTRRQQRGLTLFGLLFWAVVVSVVAVVGMKVFPSMNEYFTIVRAIKKIKESGVSTVPEVRTAFDKQATIEYGIESVSGRDLEVDVSSGKIRISFSYDKEIELMAPVYLLIKYRGEAR